VLDIPGSVTVLDGRGRLIAARARMAGGVPERLC
jgi:hypothetical protein